MESRSDKLGEIGEKEAISRIIAKYVSKPKKWERLGYPDDARDLIPKSPRITFSIDGFNLNSVKLPWRSLSDIGWCSIVGAASDHVVKGSLPRDVVVSLGLPNDWTIEMLEELYEGINDAVNEYGLRLLGGDLNYSPEPWIAVSVLGYTSIKKPPARCCGNVGDDVIVIGIYGAMGFVNIHGFEEASKYDWVVDATRRPKLYLDLAIAISSNYRYVNSSMDVSDGLGYTILELSRIMGKGVELVDYPLHYRELDSICRDEMCLWKYILNGGEEYGDVLIVNPNFTDRLVSMLEKFKIPYRIVGRVVDKEPGLYYRGIRISEYVTLYDQFMGWKPSNLN
uniref:Thiamine-monophosphate kinase n=1 Tax=Staphylothermus marinus TaxID=2280 RepID=A0A7C4H9Q4_STAMA